MAPSSRARHHRTALHGGWLTARANLHMYAGTASFVLGIGALAVAAALPLASLAFRAADGSLGTRLSFPPPFGEDWGLTWTGPVVGVSAAQSAGLDTMFGALLFTAAALVGLAVLTIFAVSAVRAGQRGEEITVRRSVGASRRAIVWGALLESGSVGLVVLVLGLVLGGGGIWLATLSWPGVLARGGTLPSLVVVGAVVGCIAVGGFFSLGAVWKRRLAESSGPSLHLHLVGLQLALSLLVLSSGGLIARRAPQLTATDLTNQPQGHLFRFTLANASPAARAAHYHALLQDLHHDLSFDTASLASPGTHIGLGTTADATTECGMCAGGGIFLKWHYVSVTHHLVSEDTFTTMGARIVAGRNFSADDRWNAPRVAIVNRPLANRHFQGGDAVGRRIKVALGSDEWYTVVGVVDGPPAVGFGAGTQPPFDVYLSILQHPPQAAEVMIRARDGNAAYPKVIEAIVARAGVTPTAILQQNETTMRASQTEPLRWFGRWFRIEGWALTLLAVVGTFALLRLWVLWQLPTLGLQRAVGATRRRLIGRTALRGMLAGFLGLLLGVWLGPSLWDVLTSAILGLPPWDTTSVLNYSALLMGVTLVAVLTPIWRVMRMTPAGLLSTTKG